MNRYKLTIAYDGTELLGWQEQADQLPTVMAALREHFRRTFHQPLEYLVGASRTDAGVHALGQVARIKIPFEPDMQTLRWAWNNSLPSSILIRRIDPVEQTFHPQHNVQSKTYFYHFFTGQRPLPFFARYGWFVPGAVDIDLLRELLQVFVGTHDFRSFCTGAELTGKTVRTVNTISVSYLERFGMYRIQVEGPSFVRYMIRRLVGAAMTVATDTHASAADIERALAQKDPQQHFLTAPAHGLMLASIVYDGDKL